MLESVAASLLNRLLGSYIEGFDPTQLSLGIWNGDLELHDLEIKKDVLRNVGLPFELADRFIGKLRVQIPWSNLSTQPIKVLIDELFAIVIPSQYQNEHKENIERSKQAVKQVKLAEYEAGFNPVKTSNWNIPGFGPGLIAKLINNVQLEIRNLHVRFEGNEAGNLVLGFLLQELVIKSTDPTGKEFKMHEVSENTYKMIKLSSIAIYSGVSNYDQYQNLEKSQFVKKMHKFESNMLNGLTSDYRYVIKPISSTCSLIIRPKRSFEDNLFKIQADFLIETVSLCLHQATFDEAVKVYQYFKMLSRRLNVSEERPAVTIKQEPLTWFRYAVNAVLQSIRTKNEKCSWTYFTNRRTARLQYQELYLKMLGSTSLTNEEKQIFADIENKWSCNDLKFFRTLARLQFAKNNSSKTITPIAPPSKGWLSLIWASADSIENDPEKAAELRTKTINELYETMDYHEDLDLSSESFFNSFSMTLFLEEFQFRLESYQIEQLLELKSERFTLKFVYDEDSYLVDADLKTMSVWSRPDPQICFNQLLRYKQNAEIETEATSLFKLLYASGSKFTDSDGKLSIDLLPTEIIYHPMFVSKILKFFDSLKVSTTLMKSFASAAKMTIDDLNKSTKSVVESFFKDRKQYDAHLNIKAPVIFVPRDIYRKDTYGLAIDAGLLKLESKVIDKQKFSDAYTNTVTENNSTFLSDLLTDRYVLQLEDATVCLRNSKFLSVSNLPIDDIVSILPQTSCSIEILHVAESPRIEVPEIQVQCKLPNLKLNYSVYIHKSLMKYLEILTEDYESSPNWNSESNRRDSTDESFYDIDTFDFSDAEILKQNSPKPQDNADIESESFGRSETPSVVVKFQLDELQLLMYSNDQEKALILNFTLDQAEFNASFYSDKIECLLLVGSLSLDSWLNPTCQTIVHALEEKNEKPLTSIKLVKANNQELSSLETEINLESLIVYLEPLTLLKMQAIINELFDDSQSTTRIEYEQDDEVGHSLLPTDVTSTIFAKFFLTSIKFVLFDDSSEISSLTLSEGSIVYSDYGSTKGFKAQLKDFRLRGISYNTECDLISVNSDQLFSLSYDLVKEGIFDSKFVVNTKSLTCYMHEEYWAKITKFIRTVIYLETLYDSASKAARSTVDTRNFIEFQFTFESPMFFFYPPIFDNKSCESNIASQYLVLHPGTFDVSNCKSTNLLEKIEASLRDSSLSQVIEFNDVSKISYYILKSVDLDFVATRSLQESNNSIIAVGAYDGTLNLNNLSINISSMQYSALIEIYRSFLSIIETKDNVSNEVESSNNLQSENSALEYNLEVNVKSLALTLANSSETQTELDLFTIYSLEDITAKLNQTKDIQSLILKIMSITTVDLRSNSSSFFKNIMPKTALEKPQMVFEYKWDNLIEFYMLELTSPTIYFSFDYLSALNNFLNETLFSQTENFQIDPYIEKLTKADEFVVGIPSSNRTIHLICRDLTIYLLADPTNENTEALKLFIKGLIYSQEDLVSAALQSISIQLCRPKRNSVLLSILDDADFLVNSTKSNNAGELSVDYTATLAPLKLKFSIADLILSTNVLNKVIQAYLDFMGPSIKEVSHQRKSLSGSELSRLSEDLNRPMTDLSLDTAESNIKSTLRLEFEFLQLVIISDLHDLPIIDFSLKPSIIKAESYALQSFIYLPFSLSAHYFNLKHSNWEPFIETWPFSIIIEQKTSNHSEASLAFKLISEKRLEIVLSTVFLTLLRNLHSQYETINKNQELHEPRFSESPFKIKNMTGYTIHIRLANSSETSIENNTQIDWKFDDLELAHKLREQATKPLISLKVENFQDISWKEIQNIDITRDSVTTYRLEAETEQKEKSNYLITVDVRLDSDSRKIVTIRSPLLLTNHLSSGIEAVMCDTDGRACTEVYKIPANNSISFPLDMVQNRPFRIRPDSSFNYTWCQKMIFWKDFLKTSTRANACRSSDDGNFLYNFHIVSEPQHASSLRNKYPMDQLAVYPPFEVQNLLPFLLSFRVYIKGSESYYSFKLKQGQRTPVYCANLKEVILLSCQIAELGYHSKKYAMIWPHKSDDFERNDSILLENEDGHNLKLKLHYTDLTKDGIAFRVSVASPYIILNHTGLNIQIRPKNYTLNERSGLSVSHAYEFEQDESSERKAIPCLFSYLSENSNNRALLKFEGTSWSNPCSFDAVGTSYEVIAPKGDGFHDAHFAISVEMGEGKYKLTRIVNIYPRFIIRNQLNFDCALRQISQEFQLILKRNSVQPVYFFQNRHPTQLIMKALNLSDSERFWSPSFDLANVGRVHIKLTDDEEVQKLVRVDIMLQNAFIVAQLSIEPKFWPFYLNNETTEVMYFWQSALEELEDDQKQSNSESDILSLPQLSPKRYKLTPKSSMPYAWDLPAASHKCIVLSFKGKERIINPIEVGKLPLWQVGTNFFEIKIKADGAYQKIMIRSQKQNKKSARKEANYEFKEDQYEEAASFQVQLHLEGIGVSLISSKLNELAYVSFRGCKLNYYRTNSFTNYDLICEWIQIDNQLSGGIYPIVFYPSIISKKASEIEAHPMLRMNIRLKNDSDSAVYHVRYASLLIQEMTSEIDEDFLFALLEFLKIEDDKRKEIDEGKLPSYVLELASLESINQQRDFYFELLHLQPLQINLSFMRTERINTEDKISSTNMFSFFLNILTMAIGNINEAPIRLNALLVENVRITAPLLVQLMQNHYGQEFFYQTHKIVGSADFLGNPIGLLNNISSGFADIFYEPYQGYIMTERPQDLGLGIARGTGKFIRKTIFGVSDSVSKFTGSISKGLSFATMDPSYQSKRRISRARNKPKHALYGVKAGANSLITGIASGFEGMARQPLEGLKKEGTAGFMKGVGKGILGFATKPIIGALDMASNISEGIRNTTTVFSVENIDRVRLPRFVNRDGIIREFSQREALGQLWLKQIDDGQFSNDDYLAHLHVSQKSFILLTYQRIMQVKSENLKTEHIVNLSDLQTIKCARDGVRLHLKNDLPYLTVYIDDASNRKFLFEKLSVAVNEYNNKHQYLCRFKVL